MLLQTSRFFTYRPIKAGKLLLVLKQYEKKKELETWKRGLDHTCTQSVAFWLIYQNVIRHNISLIYMSIQKAWSMIKN